MEFKIGDRVRGSNPKYPSYTGTIDEVFYGFVRVVVDQPNVMGPTTITSMANLALLDSPPAEVPPAPFVFSPGVQPPIGVASPSPLIHPITVAEPPPPVIDSPSIDPLGIENPPSTELKSREGGE